MQLEARHSEQSRLRTLQPYQILETPPEAAFDDLAKLAAQLCNAPFATISFVDSERQWFKSCIGLEPAEARRVATFCHLTIQSHQPFVVEDAQLDPRFAQSLAVVNKPNVRFYAGVPLVTQDGIVLGALEVMDSSPRRLNSLQLNALHVLAAQVMNQVEMRRLLREHKQAESALVGESLFAGLFSAAATGITLSYPQGAFIQTNPAFCEMVGYSEEELHGLDDLAITHQDDREQNAVEVKKVLAGEIEHFVLEKRYLRRDGTISWARASVSCVQGDDGEPLYITAVTEDITERVNAQAAASRLEEQLAMTLEHMTDAFCLLDHKWRVRYLNKVAEQLVLHTSEQMNGVTLWERFPPTTGSLLHSEFHRAVAEQTPAHFELFYAPLNNWFEVHAYPVPDGLAVYFRAITERKQALSALRASEERFEIVARATNDAIWDWDLINDKVWWSEGFAALFGYALDDAPQSVDEWMNFIHPDDRERILESFQSLIEQGGEHWVGEYRFISKNGEAAHIFDRGFLIHDAHGLPIRMVGSMVDVTERKKAEDALRESEERFRQMAETIDDVFWIWDPHQDRVVYISPRYETIFGQSREELYRNPHSFINNVHPDDLERLRAASAADPNALKLEYRLVLDNQEQRWVSVRTFPVYDAEGNIQHSVGVAHDVTQLMETTERLTASEEQYRLLFANNPHPMWVYDFETLRFLAVNQAALKKYGYREEEFLGMTILDIRPVAEIPRVMAAIAVLGTQRELAVWRHRKKNGALIDVEVLSDEITFNGRRSRLVLAHDVTERLAAEEKIRQQAALLDKAPDAILVCDLNHRIIYWNQGAEKMYGWRAEEVIGKSTRDLLYRDIAGFDRAMVQLMLDGEWVGELPHVDRIGRELLAEVRWSLVRNDAGIAESILAIKTDITERKKLEMQFMRAQRMESIGTLAGGIAHDLNNVLAPILLSLGMLKRQSKTPLEQKLLTTLESSAQRGADMVRQVLSFARGVEGERVVVDVGKVVADLENLIRDTFDRSIRFQVNIEENLLPVLGDPTQIHQVVLNLCVNARDAMPNGGDLIVTVSTIHLDSPFAGIDLVAEPGPYVLLVVADTGVGIPPELRERIFDPFFTTKEVGKGTGLGLPTVQALVKSHGGFLNMYSEVGKGTEFKIYLPAHNSAPGDEETTQAGQIAGSDGELVLVIDDEPAIRLVTQQTLESFGYRVLTAEGGKEAITLYAQYGNDIAVVLTDMMMPGMDGIALIQVLRTMNRQVKVIAASGLADHNTVARASSVGVDHFLQKPYTTESLLKMLAEMREVPQNDARAA
jgi:PAS domain S-box-containing protein